jgi:hypothetical protein
MQNTAHQTKPIREYETTIISAYSREQAIDDGVLIDMPQSICREAGVTVPCAMTAGLFSQLNVTNADKQLGQSLSGRMWDLLNGFRMAIKLSGAGLTDQLTFSLIIASATPNRKRVILVKSIIGAGDSGEPVITFLLPNED